MNLSKFKKNAISKKDQRDLIGGLSIMELIQAMWDATPAGVSSHWVNQNDGSFSGPYGTIYH